MNEKKLYIWHLADFLSRHEKRMSGEELATHLNRNNFMTEYETEYEGGRGTYTLIEATYKWLKNDLQFSKEASKVAEAFVKPDGSYAYRTE